MADTAMSANKDPNMAMKDVLSGVKAFKQQTETLGPELKATAEMHRIGEAALKGEGGSTPANPSKSKPTPAGDNPSARYGDKAGEKRPGSEPALTPLKPLGSLKKGGKIKKTGIYKLHAKERVLTASQTAKMEKKGGLSAALSGKK
jgi:hypothetical protein